MTQEERVMTYLHSNGSITPWEAFTNLNITRLAAVVFNLKRRGEEIDTFVHRDGKVSWAEYKKTAPRLATESGARVEKVAEANSTSEINTKH